MSKPIAFIIGAGKNIGAGVANVLQSKGYRVALAARSLKQEDSTSDKLHLSVDLSNPDSISPAFATLRKQWGEPSVVLYNGKRRQHSTLSHHRLTIFTAAAVHFTSSEDPISPSVADFTHDLTLNTISLYAAAKESLASFDKIPSSVSKTFFYTGNSLNVTPQPALMTLGVGKTASAHIIDLASGAYGKKGYQ